MQRDKELVTTLLLVILCKIKRQIKFTVLFSPAFFIALSLAAQQSSTDSLQQLLTKEKNISKQEDLLVNLCEISRFHNIDNTYAYALQLKQLASKNGDDTYIKYAELYQAIYFSIKGKSDSAFSISEKNLQWLRNKKINSLLTARYYTLNGLCLMKMDRYKNALQSFFDGLRIADTIHDKKQIGIAYNNIGWAFMELGEYEKAIENFRNSIQTLYKDNAAVISGTVYNNMASCYGSLQQYDSVYKYATKGIQVAKQTDDFSSEANGLNILGTFLTKEEKYKEALEMFLQAKPIREKIGDPFFIVSDMAAIAELYAKTNNTQKGIAICNEALNIIYKNNLEAKLPLIYTAMAANYQADNNYQKVAEIYKKINSLQDSLYRDANPKALAEIQTKYETEKKERLIQQQQFELTKKNYWLIAGIIFFALCCLLGILFYNRYRLKQESLLKSAVLKEQELNASAVIEAEENERKRIAADLHDGVGQMMSVAKMNLSSVENNAFSSPEEQLLFKKAMELVDESCKEIRSISHQMMPNALLKSGLNKAIREFIDKIDNRIIKINLHIEGIDHRLENPIETVLYRIVQECVNNVLKHSGAPVLDISLLKDKDGISVTIEDNGKGFDPKNKNNFEGIGLKNIMSRVAYLKGTVDFDSSPGKGTLVAIHIPVA